LPQDRNWHGNFKAPSHEMMLDFCQHLVNIGCLEDRLWHAHVVALEPCESNSRVKVTTTSSHGDSVILAKHVVVARGPTWCRQWPAFYKELDSAALAQIYHAWDLVDNPERMNRLKGRCVIVGGGLTSVHLCAQLERQCQIDLLIRRRRRVKQWDLALTWMEATADRRQRRQKFEEASMEDRAEINKSVRDGGSITPEMNAVLSELETKGAVKVREFTEIVSASWDGCWTLVLSHDTVITADHLICATGSKVDISTDPLLANLQKTHPVPMVNGLPVLSKNLQWGELPIHLMGNIAAIELGPDAVNMSGAMRGAFRIWPALASKNSRKNKRSARRGA
jgi:cation diffusion facilitator CzcD-associated flavoprotein CzcO